jgi:Domain of unknown function (DUF4336)
MKSPDGRRGVLDRVLALGQPRWVEGDRPGPLAIAEGLWAVERRFRLPGGVELPTRSFVVRGDGGALAVLSPLPDEAARRQVEALGAVRWLIAPNSFHYGGLASWTAAFPEARVFLAPGLRARSPELPAGEELAEGSRPPFANALLHAVFGPSRGISELAFFQRASRTLILTDLCFHVLDAPRARDRLFLRALGAWRRFGPSRTARAILLHDRAQVAGFVNRICRWDFVRIAVAHGEVLEGGPEALCEAFRSYL